MVEKNPPAEKKNSMLKSALFALIALVGLALFAVASAFAYQQIYKNKVYPGVYIGQYHLGGLSAEKATEFLEIYNDKIAKDGIDFFYYHPKSGEKIDLKIDAVPAGDSSVELASVKSAETAALAFGAGRGGPWWKDLLLPPSFLIFKEKIQAQIQTDNKLVEQLKSDLAPAAENPRDANVKVTSLSPLAYEIVPAKKGAIFEIAKARAEMEQKMAALTLAPIEIKQSGFSPSVNKADVESILAKLPAVLTAGDLNLNYIDSRTKERRDWNIKNNVYADWLETRAADNEFVFALNKERVFAYLENFVKPAVDVAAKNAKFLMEDGKVKEFQASQSGVSLDMEKTYAELDAIFRARNYEGAGRAQTLTLSVSIMEPDIKVSDANNLGITDRLGAGVSTFRDSHTNRIKNIALAVRRLNGVIIAPGEEFSAIKFAGPFTAAVGFLPEAVIKGKEIKNEIGGGMCQIGTTLFRMAMNSGMPITQRRNHSLVVGYYADPVNGNPGTDATLYEPDIDFRFLNDTGGYLLLQTEIDYVKQRLVFTLWGKSDGRKGWYDHPKVSKWIPAGEPQTVESDKLKPGEKKCQNAFRGAVASFTYTRVTSSSEQIERVFDSYYRPLPQICMVGPDPPAGGATSTIDGTTAAGSIVPDLVGAVEP
ncbi:hypothetical protein EPN28_01740 [Patescibacteria group bacterium]|nr:MAG: hypothetical protein EPN28_01740 [Patescibacteria group bacterium]